MSYDPTKTPEPVVGSGGSTPSGSGATRPEPAEASAPEVGQDGAGGPENPVATPAEEEREPETAGPDAESDAGAQGTEPDPDASEAKADAEAAAEPGVAHHSLAALSAKAEEYLGLAQRTKADFENYRKRAMREAAAAQERGAVKLAKALLPAIDNLDRALAHANGGAEANSETGAFVSGVEAVRNDLIGALGHVGIEPYSPEGQPFDPQFHEAVAQQPVEGTQPGTVVEVYQRGYRLGDHVLRPARVVVAA